MTYAIQNKNFDKNRVFILQKSELEKRLDPRTYHPERRNVINALKKSGHKLEPLKFISTFDKNIVKEIPENLPYLGLENIESNTGTYIQTNEKESISSAILFDKGKVLFPKLRPYLNKVYFAEFDGVCSTEFHILDSKKVSNEYLANFLRTNLVVNQTKYLMSGNTLPRLQTEDIERLLIPILPTEKEDLINKIMRNAFTYKKQAEAQAEKLLASIDDYLLGELGITLPAENSVNDFAIKQNGFELNNQNSVVQKGRLFLTGFKEIGGRRFDAEYHKKYFSAIFDTIENSNFNCLPLKKCILSLSKGIEVGSKEYVEEGIPFVRVADINDFKIDTENADKKISKENFEMLKKNYQPQINEILYSKDGTIGFCIVVEKIQEYIISGGIMRIVCNENVDNYFLKYLLSTKLYKRLAERVSIGAVIKHLTIEDWLQIPIPLPPLEKQKEIANHIQIIRNDANKLKINATQILQQAKEEIEKMILLS